MSGADLLDLFGHFLMLSMLSIGGALSTAPEMHRYLVDERGWLSDPQFVAGLTIAQAAPGPNLLFVTLLGWQMAGVTGALVTTIGILLPSSLLTFHANRWRTSHHDTRLARAIRLGLSPIAIGMTASAGWVVIANLELNPRILALSLLTLVLVLRTRLNPLWLIALGAILGGAGLLQGG